MSRFLGPRLKVVRRLGSLPGLTSKSPKGESYPPGQHGPTPLTGAKKKKLSQYGKRLQEKQKLRFNYGITERQLLNYVRRARKGQGSAGEVLIQLLEMRLDSIIFRANFAPTILAARQLINHGHVLVNGKEIDIASYCCQVQDKIQIQGNQDEELQKMSLPSHLSTVEPGIVSVKSWVNRKNVALKVQELLIIEYYSRQA